jgi:hypothetical protein
MKLWTEKPGFPPGRGCAALRPSFGGSLRMVVPYLACMLMTAQYYGLPPRVLPAIQAVEGGYPGAIHANSDGTEDYGLMQINSRWIGPLAAVKHMLPAEIRAWLIVDPCTSVAVAGTILDAYRTEEHGDLMKAVGDYHSDTPTLNVAYQTMVMSRAAAMFGTAP